MKEGNHFSWLRLWAIVLKEFIQMKRDRATLAMIIGVPMLQVILFGFAINTDPKHLPTVVVAADDSQFVRTFLQGMQNTGYFKIEKRADTEAEAEHILAANKALFIINIPPDFTRKLVRGEHPTILLEADATDPTAPGNAIAAANNLMQQKNLFRYDFQGALQYLQPSLTNLSYISGQSASMGLIIHPKYNPGIITQYNIVPGLTGLSLTMILIMITAIAITRERDRGTMEGLLATPLRPLEIMLGKIIPYIIVGYAQITLILIVSKLLFNIPMEGSMVLLYILTLPFIAANLSVGITISTIAKNPLQAVQMAVFFFTPSILLSGFIFPFLGMPQWAQVLGQGLPLTHYLVVVRGILIKGNGFVDVWTQELAILVFVIFVLLIGMKRFRQTLD